MPAMALFLAVTIAHFVLTVHWVRTFSPRPRDPDDLAFHSAVIGLGGLQAILHTVAFSIGLSLSRGLASLAATHLVIAAGWYLHQRRSPAPAPSHDDQRWRTSGPAGALTIAGGVVVSALAVQWARGASSSLRITGADAAHYHVPYAVNIALGANPFGLPATPHIYPMGTSVLASWFILPFRDPLLIDLAMLLPFLLGWFAVSRIVRETTAESGLAWGPWCALAMFSAPLFRHSFLVSADLFYASAFLAVNAVLLKACARMRLDRLDAISLALAMGMLVSTKVTGVFSAVVLAGIYGLVIVGRMRLERRRLECAGVSMRILGGAVLLAIASGGIWLIRNWWNYGSPLGLSGFEILGFEIFPGEKYGATRYDLSVLGDVRGIDHYSLAARLWHWLGVWLGTWFSLSGLLIVLLVAGVSVAWARGRALDDALRARLIFAGASAVLITAHVVLLAGVPWSSLEWTGGFSLRYALPCAALYWLVACTSGLAVLTRPRWLQWGAAAVLPVVSITWYVAHQGVPESPSAEALACFTPAGVALGLSLWALGYGVTRLARAFLSVAASVALVAAVSAAYGAQATRTDARLIQAAEADLDRLASCATCQGIDASDYRRAYAGLIAYERAHDVGCDRRRIFTTSRWDFPLELQSPRYQNQVFNARGPFASPSMLAREAPGSRPCDYVIASRAAIDTTNGVPLVNALKASGHLQVAAEAGPFVVFAAR